jgi:hypothetical protein
MLVTVIFISRLGKRVFAIYWLNLAGFDARPPGACAKLLQTRLGFGLQFYHHMWQIRDELVACQSISKIVRAALFS